MTHARPLFATLALLLGATGCSTTARSDCLDRCEAQQAEGCTAITVTDCDAFCDGQLDRNSRAGCVDEYAATERCIAGGDVCAVTPRCSAELEALVDCTRAYCDTEPDDPGLCGP